MSGINGDGGGWGMDRPNDSRLNPPQIRVDDGYYAVVYQAVGVPSYASPWWPGSRYLGDGEGRLMDWSADSWDIPEGLPGAASRYAFTGVTRDQWGTVVGSCAVRLFRAADDVLIDAVTSNATTGEFTLNTASYPDAHYIVCHKTGSPIAGASPNTLIGV